MHASAAEPWLLPFLAQIRPRPGMYLGHESARLLWHYLSGYAQARADLGLPIYGRGEPDHLTRFREWLAERHGYGGTTMGWYDMIEDLDPSERNLKTFFREFEAYLRDAGIDFASVKARVPTSWASG